MHLFQSKNKNHSARPFKEPAAPPPNIPSSFPLYLVFPKLIGIYLYLYICIICLFIVIKNNIKKYKRSIGQNTGMSKILKKVITILFITPFVQLHQNLNSGIRLANGLYSASDFVVGKVSPSSISPEGSSNGDRNPIKLFKRNSESKRASLLYVIKVR